MPDYSAIVGVERNDGTRVEEIDANGNRLPVVLRYGRVLIVVPKPPKNGQQEILVEATPANAVEYRSNEPPLPTNITRQLTIFPDGTRCWSLEGLFCLKLKNQIESVITIPESMYQGGGIPVYSRDEHGVPVETDLHVMLVEVDLLGSDAYSSPIRRSYEGSFDKDPFTREGFWTLRSQLDLCLPSWGPVTNGGGLSSVTMTNTGNHLGDINIKIRFSGPSDPASHYRVRVKITGSGKFSGVP